MSTSPTERRDDDFTFPTAAWVAIGGATGAAGVIADLAYESPAPEDETWADEDAVPEWFYIVRFKQTELWGETYTGPPNDTLQTEIPERWLAAADR